ncbi:MAG: hypothetical protein BA871_04730 [Desulfuromonadales bacterium C00003096]|nr:MAG: hypothetical protein BA871_04730 [Desulfuromonadales bacterium C00003096]
MAPSTRPDDKAKTGGKILAEKKTPAYDLRLQTDEMQDRLLAFITVVDADNTLSPSELIDLLAQNGIKENLDLEEIDKFCSNAAMGINQEDVLLAKGVEPCAGRDGWLELTVRTSDSEVDISGDEKGNVDMRTRYAFANVEIGQHVGIIHPPEYGEPGVTVNGLPIPATKGAELEVKAGEGVEIDSAGNCAIATKAGLVVFDGCVLSVTEEFLVSGDVDLSIGNIDFNGFVEVRGDVLDDFNIRARKGIRVTGSVGACRLESEGPVEVGGMNGLGSGLIRCRGDLRAGYLNQVQVECWGNVVVSREIRNSSIKSTRAILVESGVITGGDAVALDGIEAKRFGAVSGSRTLLTAGVYFPEADCLQELRNKQTSYNEQIQTIAAALGPLTERPNLPKALQEVTDLRIRLLTERKTKLENENITIGAELASYQVDEHPSANPKINVLGTLMEGVVIHLGEAVKEIKLEYNGPISIIENSEAGGVRFIEHSPLQVNATEIAKKVVADEEEGD